MTTVERASGPALRGWALDGPVRILAGPGAGKTRLLCDLYGELIESGAADRRSVLVLTFSTAAAEEIGRRIDARLRDSYAEAWISTFHSFCARLLRRYQPAAVGALIDGLGEQVCMRETLCAMSQEELGELAMVRTSGIFAQDALAFVALAKQNQIGELDLLLQAEAQGSPRMRRLAAIYLAYQQRLEQAGLSDFRDLITKAIGLLRARPALLETLRRQFRYVLVDEFQDVDPAQFDLLRILAPPKARPRLLVVGDPDQSIYAFRGTVPDLLRTQFSRVYPDARTERLEASERCPRRSSPRGGACCMRSTRIPVPRTRSVSAPAGASHSRSSAARTRSRRRRRSRARSERCSSITPVCVPAMSRSCSAPP